MDRLQDMLKRRFPQRPITATTEELRAGAVRVLRSKMGYDQATAERIVDGFDKDPFGLAKDRT